MVSHVLDFSVNGSNSLESLDNHTQQRVFDKLKRLVQNIDNLTLIPLKGKFSGCYKLKVGDYRAIYEVDHNKKVVTVHKVGHRKEIYKH